MTTLVYDHSFEGLLTAIFDVYESQLKEVNIFREGTNVPAMFTETRVVITDTTKAARVMRTLADRLTPVAVRQFYKCFLSGLPEIEHTMLRYTRYTLQQLVPAERNFGHPDVLIVHQTSRKVDREKHRMEAFVRFSLTADQLYYSIIQPDYDVLPLITRHFRERYADQRWLIYDSIRKYGMYYDLKEVAQVQLEFSTHANPAESAAVLDEKEALYRQLWQQYFTSVNIPARKNMKLHLQHMPRRYWRNLPEKMPGGKLPLN
jgi:probable DNA metabolism protein